MIIKTYNKEKNEVILQIDTPKCSLEAMLHISEYGHLECKEVVKLIVDE